MILIPQHQKKVFFSVLVAQFFSSLADNALLITAIALLTEKNEPSWTVPALRIAFYFFYISLAMYTGPLADAFSKGRVITCTNFIKLGGCALIFFGLHPLIAYSIIGLGASAYAPAKYGILPELLPSSELVIANAWIEVSTVISILLGIGLGSFLIDLKTIYFDSSITFAIGCVFCIYLIGSLSGLFIPTVGASNPKALTEPSKLFAYFFKTSAILFKDREAGIALATTSLFWAVAAVLQFIALRWSVEVLELSLSKSSLIQGIVAIGIVMGAIIGGSYIPVEKTLKLLPLGVVIGASIMMLVLSQKLLHVSILFISIGILAGILLIPMNALLQLRGIQLMYAGQSIAVQNFFETIVTLIFLTFYGLLIYFDVSLMTIVKIFSFIIISSVTMILMKNNMHKEEIASKV